MLLLPEFCEELELPLSKELTFKHHGWIQFATAEFDLAPKGTTIKVKNIGFCSLTHVCSGLIELKREKGGLDRWL